MTEMPPYLTGKDEEKDSGEEESDSSDVDDWDLPLSFDQPRHLEPIKGLERAEHSWRVKEKVRLSAHSAFARITTNAHGLVYPTGAVVL